MGQKQSKTDKTHTKDGYSIVMQQQVINKPQEDEILQKQNLIEMVQQTESISTEEEALEKFDSLDVATLNKIALERKWWIVMARICKLPNQIVKFGDIKNFRDDSMGVFVNELIRNETRLTCIISATNSLIYKSTSINSFIVDALVYRVMKEDIYKSEFGEFVISNYFLNCLILTILELHKDDIESKSNEFLYVDESIESLFINFARQSEQAKLDLLQSKFQVKDTFWDSKFAHRNSCSTALAVRVAIRSKSLSILKGMMHVLSSVNTIYKIDAYQQSCILKELLKYSSQEIKNIWHILKSVGVCFSEQGWFSFLVKLGYDSFQTSSTLLNKNHFLDEEDIYWREESKQMRSRGCIATQRFKKLLNKEVLFQLALEDKSIVVQDFIKHNHTSQTCLEEVDTYKLFICNLINLLDDDTLSNLLTLNVDCGWSWPSHRLINMFMEMQTQESCKYQDQDRLVIFALKYPKLNVCEKLEILIRRPSFKIPPEVITDIEQYQNQHKGTTTFLINSPEKLNIFEIYRDTGYSYILKIVINEIVIHQQLGKIMDVNTPVFIQTLQLACIRKDFEFLNMIIDQVAFDSNLVWRMLYNKYCLDPVKRWMHTKLSLDDPAFIQDAIRFENVKSEV